MNTVYKKWSSVLVIIALIMGLCFLYPILINKNHVHADMPVPQPEEKPSEIISNVNLNQVYFANEISYQITSSQGDTCLNSLKIEGKYVDSLMYENIIYILTSKSLFVFNTGTKFESFFSYTGVGEKIYFDSFSKQILIFSKTNNGIQVSNSANVLFLIDIIIDNILKILPSLQYEFEYRILYSYDTTKIATINVSNNIFEKQNVANGNFIQCSSFINLNTVYHYIFTDIGLSILNTDFKTIFYEKISLGKPMSTPNGVLIYSNGVASIYNNFGMLKKLNFPNFNAYTISEKGIYLFDSNTLYNFNESKLTIIKKFINNIHATVLIYTTTSVDVYETLKDKVNVYQIDI